MSLHINSIYFDPLHMHHTVKLFWQQLVQPLEGAVSTEAFLPLVQHFILPNLPLNLPLSI